MTREEFDTKLAYLKLRRKDLNESLNTALHERNWDEIDRYENLLQMNSNAMADLRVEFMLGGRLNG